MNPIVDDNYTDEDDDEDDYDDGDEVLFVKNCDNDYYVMMIIKMKMMRVTTCQSERARLHMHTSREHARVRQHARESTHEKDARRLR